MSQQPTIAELARVLLRQLYESSDAGSRQMRVVANSATAKAVLEFALDNDWLAVDAAHGLTLTAAGRAVVKKSLS